MPLNNGFKMKEGSFRLDTKKKFFTMRVVRYWQRLPRKATDAPSLKAIKARLDEALGNLIWWKVSLTGDTLRSLPTQTIL